MTITDPSTNAPQSAPAPPFSSLNPRTGAVIREIPTTSPDGVAQAVTDARRSSEAWAALPPAQRRKKLDRWRRTMADRRHEILNLLIDEAGTTEADALLEVNLALHHLDWAAKNAPTVLRPRKVNSGLLMLGRTSTLIRRPVGVVGVIGPWNYPMYTPLGSISYALATGNAVVFKPSEHTSLIAQWLIDTFAAAIPEHPVFLGVYGGGDVGATLVTSGVNKVAFTGSAPTGKKIMAACAASLTPVLMELGGKDAAIVASDADLSLAAEAITWGGFMNAGQSRAGVERVYAVDDVYDELLDRIAKISRRAVAGIDYGAIAIDSQVKIIAAHVDAALGDGGRAVVGGPTSVRAPFVDPVILAEVPEKSRAVRDETFGPVLIVNRAKDLPDAISKANAVPYALGASVFSRGQGQSIARQLAVGMVSINGVIDFGAVPSLPFGGNQQSGFGRIHGIPGLKEFTTCLAVMQSRGRLPIRPQRLSPGTLDLGVLRALLNLHRLKRW